jgi:hypothetical protein
MEPDLRSFVDLMLQKDVRGAREKLEEIIRGFDSRDDFWKGYRLALQGMVAALEAGDELTVMRRIVEGRYPPENMRELMEQMRSRISQPFRSDEERGFDSAWVQVLQILLERSNKPEAGGEVTRS